MADQRFIYLLGKYRQKVPGCAPWPRINTFSEEDLRADLAVAHELRDEYDLNTSDGAVGGGITRGCPAR